MTPSVHAFHEILAPVFHMEKGAPRVEKTCAAVADMKTAAKPVAADASDDASKVRAGALTSSVDALEAACGAAGRPDVEAKLESVHDAFHAVMEASKPAP